ncbi:MAG: PEP-CTERM sorting domain-containing protein [Planctomycetota bacterium]|nr:PEP-CTERM sorting domain-containing protein [Planctomycetota bacterium]
MLIQGGSKPYLALGLCVVSCLLLATSPARGIIFYSTGATDYNTTAPTGDLAGSGWQYQGTWQYMLGTPVADRFFITAKHVGGSVGDTFTYNGVDYTTVAKYDDPTGTDLRIWEVSQSFSDWAPLYSAGNEQNKNLVVFGRGKTRGETVTAGGEDKGWKWSSEGLGTMRWGENTITGTANGGELLYAEFNTGAGINEAHLADRDSGGAVFIKDPDDETWKLAGINYGVNGPFNLTDNPADPDYEEFHAALYDMGGLYIKDGGGWDYIGDKPQDIPSSFYVTRISSRVDWINTVIPEPGTIVLIGAGACLLLFCHRRRHTPADR